MNCSVILKLASSSGLGISRAAGFIPQYYYLGDEIVFELIGVTISVNDIYDRIENEDKEKYLKTLEPRP